MGAIHSRPGPGVWARYQLREARWFGDPDYATFRFGGVTMKENRRAERHKVRFKMVFDDGNTYSAGYVRDISRTGLFLETASPLPIGSEVRLEPVDAQDALFEVGARVIRVVEDLEPIPEAETHENDGQVGMGLEFYDLDGEASDAIENMILTLEAAQKQEHDTGTLDPFLGVYVEDAPVGGDPATDRE